MQTPLVRTAASFAAGILLGSLFLVLPWTAAACAVIITAATLLAAFRRPRHAPALLGALAALAAGAAFLLLSVLHRPADHYLRFGLPDDQAHTLVGRIASPLDRDPDRTAFLLDLETIDGITASGLVRASVRSAAVPAGLNDRIEAVGKLHPPRAVLNPGGFDYPGHLARQQVFAVMQVRSAADLSVRASGTGLLRAIQDRRERIRRAFLTSTAGDGGAVLQAMVLGEEGSLTEDLRERFLAAGVTHILSISGSHLGLVAIICFWCLRQALFLLPERHYHRLTLLLDPRKAAAFVTAVPVTLYAFLAGGQTATLRSLIMILAGLGALVMDRTGDLLAALALAALLILVPAPQALFDISFQLSYLSVLSIVVVVRTLEALPPPAPGRVHRWRRSALLLLAVSLAATAATGPLVASAFGRLSAAGIVANMLVVPAAGAVVVPLGLLTGLLSLVTGSLPLAWLDQLAADRFVALVSFFGRLPGAALRLPSPGPLVLAGYALLAVTVFRWVRAALLSRFRPLEEGSHPPRWLRTSFALSLVLIGLALLMPLVMPRPPRVTFLDVGQGDCAVIESAAGERVLIDAGGTRDNRFDTGGRVVLPWLVDNGIRTLDLVVLSHPHPDHLYGLLSVLRGVTVRELWTSGRDGDLEGYAELQALAAERGIRLRTVRQGEAVRIGGLGLEVLHPNGTAPAGAGKAYAAENDRSLVVRAMLSGTTFLFAGDIHRTGERQLLAANRDLRADVLKVPHHGSATSSSVELLNAVRPRLAVISVGAGNPYRHPSEAVLARFAERGIGLARTDRDGAVTVRPAGAALSVTAWADLVLRRVGTMDLREWTMVERGNWERLRIRGWGS